MHTAAPPVLQKAEELFAQKQYSAAEEYYNSALKNPFANAQDFDLAHCRLGIIKTTKETLKASAKILASLKNDTLQGTKKTFANASFMCKSKIIALQNSSCKN